MLVELSRGPLEGTYELIDCYCPDPTCHCQKVCVAIVDGQQHQKRYAMISYGWQSSHFYRKWGSDQQTIKMLTNGYLEPLEEQSKHADLFLRQFRLLAKSEPDFIKRFKKRYRLFKNEISTNKKHNDLFF